MKKVQAILLSLMLTMAAIGVVYGASGDGYTEGDIGDNPWADLFTTQAPEVTTSVEETTSVIETTTEPETTVEEITTEEITTEPETTTEEVTTPEPETTTEEVTTPEPETTTESKELAILAQPQDETVSSGTRVTLSIEATGQGLTYSWEMSRDGGVTWTVSTVDGHNSPAIAFVPTESYHGRMYRCVVTDENGNSVTSDAATILIEELVNQLIITSQPQDQKVSNGATTKISIGATGQGLKYSWEISRDGGATWSVSTVDGSKSPVISFVTTESYHGRMYRCVVTDENGNSVTSDGATVLINELVNELMIVTQPQNKTVSNGERAKITIGATGQGLKYNWELSRDGGITWSKSTIDGYNTSAITFTATESYHGRMYRCVVTDKNGNSVTSNGATVLIDTLVDELMIIAQPQSKTVSVGNTTKITIGATGQGLTYSWEMSRDGGTTWTTSTVDGSKSSVITFVPNTSYHGRMYRCVVTDKNGNSVTSNGATVLIDELANDLMIVTQPQDKEVSVGETTKIAIGATGPGLKYSWELSRDGGLTWATSTVDGYNTSAITFTATEGYHGRMYRCVVTDENGNKAVSNGAVVVIKELASELMILAQPIDVTSKVGVTEKISVKATGKDVKYRWELSRDGGNTWNASTVDGYNSPTITFTTTASYEGRMYRCVVTDADGNSVASRGALVTVE